MSGGVWPLSTELWLKGQSEMLEDPASGHVWVARWSVQARNLDEVICSGYIFDSGDPSPSTVLAGMPLRRGTCCLPEIIHFSLPLCFAEILDQELLLHLDGFAWTTWTHNGHYQQILAPGIDGCITAAPRSTLNDFRIMELFSGGFAGWNQASQVLQKMGCKIQVVGAVDSNRKVALAYSVMNKAILAPKNSVPGSIALLQPDVTVMWNAKIQDTNWISDSTTLRPNVATISSPCIGVSPRLIL